MKRSDSSSEIYRKFTLYLKSTLIIGMLISLFLVYEHFSPAASEFCKFGNAFDCGIVNKGPYANVDGISYLITIEKKIPIPLISFSDKGFIPDLLTSNAFLGFITLLILFLLVNSLKSGANFFWIIESKKLKWIRGILIFSVAYGLFLFLIQHFILKTYCIFCLGLDITIIISLILSSRLK